MSRQSFSDTVRFGRQLSRWLFVLITWLIAIVFLWDFWRVFRSFAVSTLLESSLPVFAAVINLAVGTLLVRYRAVWLFRLFVGMFFFLSIVFLYSYVGVKLTERFETSASINSGTVSGDVGGVG